MVRIQFENGQEVEFEGNPTDADIEEAARSLNISTGTTPTPTKAPGFVQSTAQAIASPFLKSAITVSSGAARVIGGIVGGKEGAQRAQDAAIEGVDAGYFGNIKPFGADALKQYNAGEISGGEFTKRAGAEAGGNFLEIASYGLAPLKGIKGVGFLKSIAKSSPFAATFGLGEGLQAVGEGKGAGEAAVEGTIGGIGSAIGFGIMSKGSNIIGNWGAKALQSPAVRAAGNKLIEVAEKTWSTLPEAFTGPVSQGVDYLANKSARRAYNVLKQDFDTTFKQAIDSNIDAIIPEVNNPELSLGKFQRGMSAELGAGFNKSSALYENVKANSEQIGAFTNTVKRLQNAPQGFEYLKYDFAKPKTLKEILDMKDSLTSIIPTLDNNGKSFMRDVVSNMLSDTRNVLEKTNPDLLNEWDLGYQSWKKAVDLYTSNPLSEIKSVGEVDTFIDKMLNNTLTRPESNAVTSALQKSPESAELFLESVLRRAKSETPEQGSKTIQTFLDNWESLLNPNQVKLLDDVSQFMDQNFDTFIDDMKSLSTSKETTAKLAEQRANIKVSELVDKGNFDAIADNFFSIRNSDELMTALKPLSPNEKRVVGLSLTKNLFDESMPLFDVNPDGTFNISAYVDAFKKTMKELEKLGGKNKDGLLKQLYSPEQIKGFDDVMKAIDAIENVKEVPKGDIRRWSHLLLSALYAKIGYPGAAVMNLNKGVGPSTDDFYKTIENLIDTGYINKNLRMTVGDLLRGLALPAGVTTGTVSSGVIE